METEFEFQPTGLCLSCNPITYGINNAHPNYQYRETPIYVLFGGKDSNDYCRLRYFCVIKQKPLYRYTYVEFDISSVVAPKAPYIKDIYSTVSVNNVGDLYKCFPLIIQIVSGLIYRDDWTKVYSEEISVINARRSYLSTNPLPDSVLSCRLSPSGEIHYYPEEIKEAVLPLLLSASVNKVSVLSDNTFTPISVAYPETSSGKLEGLWVYPLSKLPASVTGRWTIYVGENPIVDIITDRVPECIRPITVKFLSTIGIFDYMVFTGSVKVKNTFRQDEDSRYISYNSSVAAPRKLQRPYTKSFTVYTGYLNNDREFLFMDLMLSEEVYIILADGTEIPIFITIDEMERDISDEEPTGYMVNMELQGDIAPYNARKVYNYMITEDNDAIIPENNNKISL